jgi:hypothetical protein
VASKRQQLAFSADPLDQLQLHQPAQIFLRI